MIRYPIRPTHVPHKVTMSTKLQSTQHSSGLALRSTDFCAPEDLNFQALALITSLVIVGSP